MSSILTEEITVPGRPEVQEVSDGIYACVQPDGTWWINKAARQITWSIPGFMHTWFCVTQLRQVALL